MWRPTRTPTSALAAAGEVAMAVAVTTLMGCVGSVATRREVAPPAAVADLRIARVSLGMMTGVTLGATGAWQLRDGAGRIVARGDSDERVVVSSSGSALRISPGVAGDGDAPTQPLHLTTTAPGAVVSVNGQRYRGELALASVDSAVRVINHVGIEAYLRGVVPRELGVRSPAERAALEAQAVAARSYAVVRLGNASRAFDLVATTGDQVYGGVAAENPTADAAIAATAGLVLYYGDRVVSAPYFSTCGGSTAQPDEVWRQRGEPFLQRVSDRIPGTDRYYCDIAPRFRWERSWRGDTLTAVIERYLRAYTRGAPAAAFGAVRGISVEGRTPSGRVTAIRIDTERGSYRVEGNDTRYVLRSPGGELLNSTYFSPDVVEGPDGRLARLTLRGLGYGHGVGMCQWGAIGRARAGQDFRTILRTYFPGTTVARAY